MSLSFPRLISACISKALLKNIEDRHKDFGISVQGHKKGHIDRNCQWIQVQIIKFIKIMFNLVRYSLFQQAQKQHVDTFDLNGVNGAELTIANKDVLSTFKKIKNILAF